MNIKLDSTMESKAESKKEKRIQTPPQYTTEPAIKEEKVLVNGEVKTVIKSFASSDPFFDLPIVDGHRQFPKQTGTLEERRARICAKEKITLEEYWRNVEKAKETIK